MPLKISLNKRSHSHNRGCFIFKSYHLSTISQPSHMQSTSEPSRSELIMKTIVWAPCQLQNYNYKKKDYLQTKWPVLDLPIIFNLNFFFSVLLCVLWSHGCQGEEKIKSYVLRRKEMDVFRWIIKRLCTIVVLDGDMTRF